MRNERIRWPSNVSDRYRSVSVNDYCGLIVFNPAAREIGEIRFDRKGQRTVLARPKKRLADRGPSRKGKKLWPAIWEGIKVKKVARDI